MSEVNSELQRKVEMAAGIIAGSQHTVGISRAMEIVGFSEEERRNMALYQKVRRRSLKLCVVDKKAVVPIPAVEVAPRTSSTTTSSLSPESEADPTNNNNTATTPSTPFATSGEKNDGSTAGSPSPQVQRRLLESLQAASSGRTSKVAGKKKHRRTSKELQRHNSVKVESNLVHKKAMKAATLLVQQSHSLPENHPEKKSIRRIVKETNEKFKSNISNRTVTRYVSNGLFGISPLKKGPVGDFSKVQYDALKGAYTTYLKLEQAESRKQSSRKQMAKLLNATVNKAGFAKTSDDLARKLQRDTANQFEVGKANIMEQRRVMWTTYYNLNVWFDTWKAELIELGFAREKLATDNNVEGELFFFEGQTNRVLNVDETDGSIDDTTGQRGGRPPMTFFAPNIAGGATAVNKSDYSATIICGSSASGEPVPPHFQLKSMAQNPQDQRLSVDWFTSTKDVLCKAILMNPALIILVTIST